VCQFGATAPAIELSGVGPGDDRARVTEAAELSEGGQENGAAVTLAAMRLRDPGRTEGSEAAVVGFDDGESDAGDEDRGGAPCDFKCPDAAEFPFHEFGDLVHRHTQIEFAARNRLQVHVQVPCGRGFGVAAPEEESGVAFRDPRKKIIARLGGDDGRICVAEKRRTDPASSPITAHRKEAKKLAAGDRKASILPDPDPRWTGHSRAEALFLEDRADFVGSIVRIDEDCPDQGEVGGGGISNHFAVISRR